MKVVMTLLVRDEEDILEANLRFHEAAGVDFFIVTDNASVDGTPQILQEWVDRGMAQVIREEQDDYAQSVWVTRMARMAAVEHGADWVIHADADEFLQPRRGTLRQVLEGLPDDVGQLRLPRVDFPPTREAEQLASEGVPFWRTMQVREVRSFSAAGVPLPAKVMHRAHPDALVEQGNHAVRQLPWPAPDQVATPITILHFPRRTWARFEHKIRVGGAAYARNRTLAPEIGRTWREQHAQLEAGTLRARYEADVLDDAALQAGIATGTHVLDRRLASRLDVLMGGASDAEPVIARVRAIGWVGLIADYDELIRDPELLRAWAASFDEADAVTLVVDASGRDQSAIETDLVPAMEGVGWERDTGPDLLVTVTPGGQRDHTQVGCRVIGTYSAAPSALLGPSTRNVMRGVVLGMAISPGGAPEDAFDATLVDPIVELAMGIEGHLTPVECRVLVELAARVHHGAVVEVGSFRGRSTVALAKSVREGVDVYAVDPHAPFVGEHGGVFGPPDRAAFFRNLLDVGIVERVRLVNLPSVDAAAGFTPAVELLWLDGDHSDAGVDADFRAWDPTLRTGAYVAFHDAIDPVKGPGRVAAAAIATGRYELVERVDKVVVIRRVAPGRR